nr:unnamed protein product [Callosobruchus chinensis]
MSPGLD